MPLSQGLTWQHCRSKWCWNFLHVVNDWKQNAHCGSPPMAHDMVCPILVRNCGCPCAWVWWRRKLGKLWVTKWQTVHEYNMFGCTSEVSASAGVTGICASWATLSSCIMDERVFHWCTCKMSVGRSFWARRPMRVWSCWTWRCSRWIGWSNWYLCNTAWCVSCVLKLWFLIILRYIPKTICWNCLTIGSVKFVATIPYWRVESTLAFQSKSLWRNAICGEHSHLRNLWKVMRAHWTRLANVCCSKTL